MPLTKFDNGLVSDLWYFTVAARHSSFTRAAKELGVTQGAVSQRIMKLEKRLGLMLFRRVGRVMTLSEQGKALHASCQNAFYQIDETLDKLQSQKSKKILQISCYPTVAMEWLIPRLDQFNRQYDHIRLRIKAELHRLDRLNMHRESIDVALRYDKETYQDLEAIPLMEEQIFPVCSPDYYAQNTAAIRNRDFRNLTLLHDSMPWEGADPTHEWRAWFAGNQLAEQEADQGIFFNFLQLAYRAAMANQGIAMGRSLLVADHLNRGELVQLYDGFLPSGATYHLLTPYSFRQQSPEKLFVDWVYQSFLASHALLQKDVK